MDSSVERAKLRLQQIGGRLLEKHPRAAKDPVLASLTHDLNDILKYEVIDRPEEPAECFLGHQGCESPWHRP